MHQWHSLATKEILRPREWLSAPRRSDIGEIAYFDAEKKVFIFPPPIELLRSQVTSVKNKINDELVHHLVVSNRSISSCILLSLSLSRSHNFCWNSKMEFYWIKKRIEILSTKRSSGVKIWWLIQKHVIIIMWYWVNVHIQTQLHWHSFRRRYCGVKIKNIKNPQPVKFEAVARHVIFFSLTYFSLCRVRCMRFARKVSFALNDHFVFRLVSFQLFVNAIIRFYANNDVFFFLLPRSIAQWPCHTLLQWIKITYIIFVVILFIKSK